MAEHDFRAERPDRIREKRLRNSRIGETIGRAVPGLLATAILGVVATGVAYVFGREGPHDVVLKGEVRDERELYGNMLVGYATERSGVKGFLERTVSDLTRPGEPMRLYALEISEAEWKTKSWFREKQHRDDYSAAYEFLHERNEEFNPLEENMILYMQSEGDIADIGDAFTITPEELGRISKAFAMRGIKYTYEDEDGNKTVIPVHGVFKNSNIEFTQAEEN